MRYGRTWCFQTPDVIIALPVILPNFHFTMFIGGVKVALDVGWQIGRDEVNNDIQGVDLANGQQHVVTVKRTDKGRRIKVSVSSNCFKLLVFSPRKYLFCDHKVWNTILSFPNSQVNRTILPFRWMITSLPLNLGFLMRAQILNWTIQNISTLVEMVSFVLHSLTRSAVSGYGSVKCVKSSNSLVTAVNF